jgi:hypothetical protein
VLWSEEQAERLRHLARGERVNDIDWENVIEEIESVGRSGIVSVKSHLLHELEHLLKAVAWPQALSARKWQREAVTFLDDARIGWAPSMCTRIDLAELYATALERVRDLDYEEGPSGPFPERCPVSLDKPIEGKVPALLERFRTGI